MGEPDVVDEPERFDEPVGRCHLCGSERLTASATDHQGRRIDRCGDCGIEFLNPQYSDGYLTALYEGYGGISDESWTGHDEATNRRRRGFHHYYLGLIEHHAPKGRFLGLGCGDGLELRVAMERGWMVEAFDVDPTAVRNARNELGITAYSGDFTEASFDAPYDCIYLHHVLEHPKNPQDYLRRIHQLLTPRGVAMIASPNVGSLASRYKSLVSRLGLKSRPFKHYDAWQHLFFFTPGKLARLMEERYDFEVLTARAGMDWRVHPLSLPQWLLKRFDRLTSLKSKFMLLARRRQDDA